MSIMSNTYVCCKQSGNHYKIVGHKYSYFILFCGEKVNSKYNLTKEGTKSVMMAGNNEILKELENFKSKVILSLQELVELDVTCKSVIQCCLDDTSTLTNETSVIRIQAVIDYMYEKVNIGNWKEVPLFIRKTITIASYIRLLALIKCSAELTEDIYKESVKIIDFGIMFGRQLDSVPQLLQNCATIMNPVHLQTKYYLVNPTPEEKTSSETIKLFHSTTIPVIDCPSMEQFYKDYIVTETPVVLDNCMNHWPALVKWKDLNYFIKLAGFRTVSVELGSKYTDSDWTQKLMTVEEFIKGHIYQPEGTTGYLAQYQLFDQIPELKQDIIEPEYCCFSDTNDPVDINAWYGPKGTVSPLHHDPKRNLLAQVIGEKQLLLFSPEDSECLYPHQHKLLNNTGQVDPREPDLVKYPKYKDAKAYYCILKPGQMLYIPPRWWHFVESLSISFSVSFWWD